MFADLFTVDGMYAFYRMCCLFALTCCVCWFLLGCIQSFYSEEKRRRELHDLRYELLRRRVYGRKPNWVDGSDSSLLPAHEEQGITGQG